MNCKVSFKFSRQLGGAGKRRTLNIAHNRREKDALRNDWNKDEHIDPTLSHLNEQLVAEDYDLDDFLRDELTDKILKHNAKCERQRHKERCVDVEDFISQVRGKAQEVVMQLGDTKEFKLLCAERGIDEARRIHGEFLKAAFEWWKSVNPQYKVFNATIHFDEAVPHLHLDFIPICDNENRLGYIVNRRGALRQMGFSDKSEAQQKSDFMYTRWVEFERMAAQNTPDYITIEPSEPSLDDGKDPPEWRKIQAAKARFEVEKEEILVQGLADIPKQPPLYVAQPFPEVQIDEPIRALGEGLFDFKQRHKEWADFPKRQAAWDKAEAAKVEASKAERAAWAQEHGLADKVVKQAQINVQDKLQLDTERQRQQKAALKNKRDYAQNRAKAAELAEKERQLADKERIADRVIDLAIGLGEGHRAALRQPIDGRQTRSLTQDNITPLFRKEVHNEPKQNTNHNHKLPKHDTYDTRS